MMPTRPGPNFVVGQARFALGAFQTVFHAMLRFLNTSQLGQGRVGRRVGKMVIVLEGFRTTSLASDEQQLLGTFAASRELGRDPRRENLDHERAFLRVAHFQFRPSFGGQPNPS